MIDRKRLKEIFAIISEAPMENRETMIEKECGTNAELRSELMELLSAHDAAEAFMGAPTVESRNLKREPQAYVNQALPREIGGRPIIKKLGEGGFGEVYLAEQETPVKRHVALKVVRQGLATREVIARFESERQALAMMSHPGIAQVYDAGTTEDGRSYFVMEYVPGEPITSYCKRHQLSVRRIVGLMEKVCLAVEHAHQKGVIHRDIKPSNVLVGEVNDAPAPKVIDFGIAKAIDQSADRSAGITATAQIVGTPQYMSPEQISFGSHDIDTRADVYSLGALLYQLLTGQPVFDSQRIQKAGLAELEQIIRDETPIRPSRRVIQQGHDTTRSSRLLRGELDWIVGKALEKDRDRRYPTATALANDLQRYLNGEAVQAGPPSGIYRLRKFIGRHKAEVVASAAVLAMLVTLVIVSMTTATREEAARRQAERELQKFEQIAAFTEEMISGIDPRTARGLDTELLKKILGDAQARLQQKPPEDAEVEVRLRTMIGRAHTSVANWENAEEQLRLAVTIAEESDAVSDDLLMEVQSSLAQMLGLSGRNPDALPIFEAVAENRTRLHGPDDVRTLEAKSNVGVMYSRLDRPEDSLRIQREVYEGRKRVLGKDHDSTIATLNNLAVQTGNLGDTEESVRLLKMVLQHQIEKLGDDHARTLMTRNNLANALQDLNKHEEALIILREVVALKKTILEPHHPSMLISINNLASSLGQLEQYEESIALLENATKIAAAHMGQENMYTLTLQHNLAKYMSRAGQTDEALDDQVQVVEGFVKLLGNDNLRTISARDQLSNFLLNAGRFEEAIQQASIGSDNASTSLPQSHQLRAASRESLGKALAAAGRHRRAIVELETAYRDYRDVLGEDHDATKACAAAVVASLNALGQTEEAAPWIERSAPKP